MCKIPRIIHKKKQNMVLLTINYPFNVFNTPAKLFVIFNTIIYYKYNRAFILSKKYKYL